MSISLSSVSAVSTPRSATGLETLGEKMLDVVRKQEEGLTGGIKEALDPSSPLMSLPQPVREQFRKWDQMSGSPEQLKAAQKVKQKILQMQQDNQDFIRERVAFNGDKLRLELSLKAINKAMSGVQQLLSAQ